MGEWKDKVMWRDPTPQGKTEREQQLELDLEQAKAENLRQEVAKMNKEQDSWQQCRIQAAIAAMQGMIISDAYANTEIANSYTGEKKRVKWGENKIAKAAVAHADALIAEIKRSDDVYAECRRMDAINTASVCENMTKLQNELQKK